jgi:predicted phage-related endonuclease
MALRVTEETMQVSESITEFGKVECYTGFTHDEWLALRHEDVTASKIGALFGVHPYSTPLQLYSEKIQLNPRKSEDSGILRRGRWFEAAALKAVREMRPDWKIEEPCAYLRDPERRIGATPDAQFVDENGEIGVLQVKTVARSKWAEDWGGDDDDTAVPFWITLQAYVEATLANTSKAAVAALLIDEWNPEVKIIEFDCPRSTYGRLAREVNRFWEHVHGRTPPKPDYLCDGDVLAGMYTGAEGVLDLSGDAAFQKLLDEREAIHARRDQAVKDAKDVKARIIHTMDNADAVICGPRVVTFREQTRKSYVVNESTFRVMRVGKRGGK